VLNNEHLLYLKTLLLYNMRAHEQSYEHDSLNSSKGRELNIASCFACTRNKLKSEIQDGDHQTGMAVHVAKLALTCSSNRADDAVPFGTGHNSIRRKSNTDGIGRLPEKVA